MITTVTKLPTNPETTSKRTDKITTNPTITELPATEENPTNVENRTENITTSPTTSGEVQSGVTFQPTSENDGELHSCIQERISLPASASVQLGVGRALDFA